MPVPQKKSSRRGRPPARVTKADRKVVAGPVHQRACELEQQRLELLKLEEALKLARQARAALDEAMRARTARTAHASRLPGGEGAQVRVVIQPRREREIDALKREREWSATREAEEIEILRRAHETKRQLDREVVVASVRGHLDAARDLLVLEAQRCGLDGAPLPFEDKTSIWESAMNEAGFSPQKIALIATRGHVHNTETDTRRREFYRRREQQQARLAPLIEEAKRGIGELLRKGDEKHPMWSRVRAALKSPAWVERVARALFLARQVDPAAALPPLNVVIGSVRQDDEKRPARPRGKARWEWEDAFSLPAPRLYALADNSDPADDGSY